MRVSQDQPRAVEPLFTAHLFPPLLQELLGVLRGLTAEQWTRPTACPGWQVRDIAAHLLDVDLRRLSVQRDGHALIADRPIDGYADLVAWLNHLNAEWVAAARRLSPRLLLELLERSGTEVAALFASLDPFGPAIFPVAWAGEGQSANWFDIGREYTERWLHQQQIREAVGAPGLDSKAWLHPVLELFLRALPRAYADMDRAAGSTIVFEITGPAGGSWTLRRGERGWDLFTGEAERAEARLRLDQDTAWRLLSKGLGREAARERVEISGDQTLGAPFLGALAIMG